MKSLKFMLAGLAAVALSSNVQAGGNILVNGGFENEPQASNSAVQGPGYLLLTGSDVPGWTIAAGHYGTFHENPGPWPTISGAYSLNTDGEGTGGNNVDIYQDFSTANGASYSLAYDWEVWQANAPGTDLQVSVEDLTSSTFLYNALLTPTTPSLVVQHVTTSFLGDGDTYRLEVQETPQSGFNDNEYVVDNFSVQSSAVGVPDATTWSAEGMAALALVGMFFAFQRSTKLQAATI
jgi:hypothetical protein